MNYSFDWFGSHLQFVQQNQNFVLIRDGARQTLPEEEWKAGLEAQIAKSAALLARRLETEEKNQDEFLRETDSFLIRQIRHTQPNTAGWKESKRYIAQIRARENQNDLDGAYRSLRKAELSERQVRWGWERYLETTGGQAQLADNLRRDLAHEVIVSASVPLAVGAAVAVAPVVVGAAVAAGASAAVAGGAGLLAGMAVGGIAGDVTSLAGASLVEQFRKIEVEGDYEVDGPFIEQAGRGGAVAGAVAGVPVGAFATAGMLTQEAVVVAGQSGFETVVHGAKVLFVGAKEGIPLGTRTLLKSAKTAAMSQKFWIKTAGIGTGSAAARVGYDLFDEKDSLTIAKNAGKAFGGGALCGAPFQGVMAANYIVMDLFSDFSRRYLIDVRQKFGDEKGLAIAGGLEVAENGLAIAAYAPIYGSYAKATKVALSVTAFSMLMEANFQHRAGKEIKDMDPGRFVGMSVWGHAVVVLPKVILEGAIHAVDMATAFARTTQLTPVYVAFVNPSVSNLQAQINGQNWDNVMIGNTVRHSTVMVASRFIQSTVGMESPIAWFADDAIGLASIVWTDQQWPVYEGVPGMWKEGLSAATPKPTKHSADTHLYASTAP